MKLSPGHLRPDFNSSSTTSRNYLLAKYATAKLTSPLSVPTAPNFTAIPASPRV